MVCATQLGNYAVEIIQMTLESAWIYKIHHFQLKCVSIYRKEVNIIAITYFLATLDAKTAQFRIDLINCIVLYCIVLYCIMMPFTEGRLDRYRISIPRN